VNTRYRHTDGQTDGKVISIAESLLRNAIANYKLQLSRCDRTLLQTNVGHSCSTHAISHM